MKRLILWLLVVLLVVFAGIQFVPVSRTNPPVVADFNGPPEVKAVLKRSCYDCHSNETRWPWYAYVAPVSWLVAGDVEEAREHLNFSAWGRLSAKERLDLREECYEEVAKGNMPLGTYLWLHPDARLSDADKEVLRRWAGVEAKGRTGEEEEEEEEEEHEHRHNEREH